MNHYIELPTSLMILSSATYRSYVHGAPCETVLTWLIDHVVYDYLVEPYKTGTYIYFGNLDEMLMFKLVFSEHFA